MTEQLRADLMEAISRKASSHYPSEEQLEAILLQIHRVRQSRPLCDDDWIAAAYRWIPSAGSRFREGRDYSDLNALLDQLLEAQKESEKSEGRK